METIEEKSRKLPVIFKTILKMEKNKVATRVSILVFEALTENRQQIMYLIGVEENNPQDSKSYL